MLPAIEGALDDHVDKEGVDLLFGFGDHVGVGAVLEVVEDGLVHGTAVVDHEQQDGRSDLRLHYHHNTAYSSFRSRTCSCSRRTAGLCSRSPSCRTCSTRGTPCPSSSRPSSCPAYLHLYLFSEDGSAVLAGSVFVAAGGRKGNFGKVQLDGVEFLSGG